MLCIKKEYEERRISGKKKREGKRNTEITKKKKYKVVNISNFFSTLCMKGGNFICSAAPSHRERERERETQSETEPSAAKRSLYVPPPRC